MNQCIKNQNVSETKLKIHGTLSISLIFTALGIGFFSILTYSLTVSILYLLSVMLLLFLATYLYCSKCSSRDNCNHLFMGKLSKLLSPLKKGNYTTFDIIFGIVFPSLLVYTIPQFWLYKNIYYMVSFWLLTIVGLIDIYVVVCRSCSNIKCAFCRNKNF